MDELAKAYDTLGVPPSISTPDLQRYYRELVKRWHPDQFGHDEEQKRVADETLRDINAAYQRVMQERKAAAEGTEAEPQAAEPKGTPAEEFVEPDPVAESNPGPVETSGMKNLVLGLALILVIIAAVVAWRQKWGAPQVTESAGKTKASETVAPAQPAPKPSPPAAPGPVIAHRICITTESFVVDVWHNGKLVPDKQRKMLADRFGATTEEVTLTLREGDWLVFNPVKNRFRWNDSLFFGVSGMTTNRTVAFESSAKDGRWTYIDDITKVSQFIQERDNQGYPVFKIEKNRMWSEGPGFMNFAMGTNWNGEPVWGAARNTYIKFVAKPLTRDTASVK